MVSSIRQFWKRLEGTVHPDDTSVFASYSHTFNLDFPPPAFIGDIDNAPVVILMLNGGYDQSKTPAEFAEPNDRTEYLSWLKGERAEIPKNLSTYYTQQAIFPWVRDGHAAIANAAAYRSSKLTSEPQNKKLADLLPSVKAHRKWLREEVLPAAQNGERLVVAHRWSLWDIGPDVLGPFPNFHYSRAPASPYLSNDLRATISSWLAGRARM